MSKINREEYEILKSLDEKWKWIARDKDRGLYAYTEKPVRKYDPSPYWDTETEEDYSALELFDEIHLFQFIQWEDEEPHNIAELIEEYESEETEVKNIEELKSWFEDEKLYVGEYVKHKIDQLDEPDSDYAYQKGFREGERQTAEYFERITEEPTQEQVWKYLSEHGIEVVDKEPETVADVIADFFKALERLKEVMNMEVEELEE